MNYKKKAAQMRQHPNGYSKSKMYHNILFEFIISHNTDLRREADYV